jgi:hypothetical protein
MPIARYDRLFGGDAAKALRAMVAKYGAEKGRRVFYATVNKRKQGRPER